MQLLFSLSIYSLSQIVYSNMWHYIRLFFLADAATGMYAELTQRYLLIALPTNPPTEAPTLFS